MLFAERNIELNERNLMVVLSVHFCQFNRIIKNRNMCNNFINFSLKIVEMPF